MEELNKDQVKVDITKEATPAMEAARYLHTALPMFKHNLEKLTGIQAKRVLSSLIESPLEQETPKFSTSQAKELYNVGLAITNAKFILFTASLNDKQSVNELEKEIEKV